MVQVFFGILYELIMSGLAASMFMFKVTAPVTHMKEKLNLEQRLANRKAIAPQEFTDILTLRYFLLA